MVKTMPTRILRPGLRTSEKWNATSYSAQSLYIGILLLVDDFGRYEARPTLLHAECRGLRADAGNVQATASDLRALASNKLIEIYEVEGREYLQMTNWQERVRVKQSRWPANPRADAGKRQQMPANDSSPRADASKCPPPTPDAVIPTPGAVIPTPAPSPSANESNSRTEIVQYSEAEADLKEISKRVFNRSIAIWNPDWDAGLRDAMPAEREQWEALKWLYSLPGNHEIFTNTRVPGWTKRRQDITALIQNLNREQQKSWVSRRDYFDYLAQQKKNQEDEPEGYLGMQPA